MFRCKPVSVTWIMLARSTDIDATRLEENLFERCTIRVPFISADGDAFPTISRFHL